MCSQAVTPQPTDSGRGVATLADLKSFPGDLTSPTQEYVLTGDQFLACLQVTGPHSQVLFHFVSNHHSRSTASPSLTLAKPIELEPP